MSKPIKKQVVLRVKADIKRAAVAAAKRADESLNAFCERAIANLARRSTAASQA